jgi:AcrR family transcriptional regulator
LKKLTPQNTPLALAVKDGKTIRTTPLDILQLARRRWLKGEKISIDGLAKESGVSRITIYRWVGNKDFLMGEVLWSTFGPGLKKIIKETPGIGIEHIVEVHRRLMEMILSFPPMQRFIKEDPTYALRLVTTSASCTRERSVQVITEHLEEQESKGYIHLPAPANELAEMIIRSNESLLYSDVISGRPPAIEQACKMIRMFLTSGSNAKKKSRKF